MPRGAKGRKPGQKSQPLPRGKDPPVQGSSAKTRGHLPVGATSTPRKETQAGRRSKTSSRPLASFQGDPDSIIRESRKSRKATKSAQVRDQPQQNVEALHAEQLFIDDGALPGYSEEVPSSLGPETALEDIFYRKWGYLPPLDEDAVAVIEAIMANPSKASDYARIGPEKPAFNKGLKYRNVFLTASTEPDPYADDIQQLKPPKLVPEAAEDEKSQGKLWAMDQANCSKGSNEALFQRTLMMSFIARHHWMDDTHTGNKKRLVYSVEETWTCPPMPSRTYYVEGGRFLSQPRPDLAVSFRREALIPNYLWNEIPVATERLACYEDPNDEIKMGKVFHFFTIEAKRSLITPDDTVGKRQSLNNASQALHNMYELFKDAGSDHEKEFFSKVRFFSVVASTEGLTVRIHRATKEPADGSGEGFIMKERPDYPLRFEYREICRIHKDNFDRENVLRMLERILLGYGVGELHGLLRAAVEALMKKLMHDPDGMKSRQDINHYRYGQKFIKPSSRPSTPALSRAQSTRNSIVPKTPQGRTPSEIVPSQRRAQSETIATADTPHSDRAASARIEVVIPTKSSNQAQEKTSRKRPSGKSGDDDGDDGPERSTRVRHH